MVGKIGAKPKVAIGQKGGSQLIVKFKDGDDSVSARGASATARDKIVGELKLNKVAELASIKSEVFEVPSEKFDETLRRLSADPRVEFAEPDYHIDVERINLKPSYSSEADTVGFIPNDPQFTQLWGMQKIDASEAWNISRGDSSIVIGVIDTGIDYNHPDLAANMWVNPGEIAGNGIDDDNNGYIDDIHGYNFMAGSDGDPMDDEGHGTHVAGTIGAIGNNNIGVAGVMHDVQLMALKFLGPDGGSLSGAIMAIEYATSMGATLTNNSWGGGGYSSALYNAIAKSGQAGQLFIAAAGNDANNNDTNPSYPDSYNLDNIISVASTTSNDSLSAFSNYGITSVDIGAPGSGIYSTVPNNGYATASGTSMAAPHVAGAAGLVWAANSNYSAIEVKSALLANADPVSALANYTMTGARLNVFKSLSPPEKYQISGTVWHDLDQDGTIDANEPTISDRTIFIDRNTNGVLDADEISTNTDATGYYSLTASNGTYTVAQVIPSGWEQSVPNDGIVYTINTSLESGQPSYNWNDISEIGTNLQIGDEERVVVSLPWNFNLYGHQTDTFYVHDNGFITPDSVAPNLGMGHFWNNTTLPNLDVPNGMIAGYWDDLDPGAGGAVYYYIDQENKQAIFQWESVPFYSYPSETVTFQIILHQTGDFSFQYKNISEIQTSATIGAESIQNDAAFTIPYGEISDGMSLYGEAVKKGWTVNVGGADQYRKDFGSFLLASEWSTIEEAGSVKLYEHLVSKLYAFDDGNGPENITVEGIPVGASSYSGWSLKGIEDLPDSDLLLGMWYHAPDKLWSLWDIDASGALVDGQYISTDQAENYENLFDQDFI